MPRIHKYGETKNNSNYDGNCTSRDFQFGTWKITGLLIFVEQRVPKFTGSHPAEAVGFLGRKNLQHVFIRRGSKAVGPMS